MPRHDLSDTVGLIGLGNAGSALAGAFSGQCPLVGYDANPARREAVADLDLQWAGSSGEVAELADTILLSLPKPEASTAVVGELIGGARPPKLIVETSTITPNTARDLGAVCEAAGVAFGPSCVDAERRNGTVRASTWWIPSAIETPSSTRPPAAPSMDVPAPVRRNVRSTRGRFAAAVFERGPQPNRGPRRYRSRDRGAQRDSATLWTQDADFEGRDGVQFKRTAR